METQFFSGFGHAHDEFYLECWIPIGSCFGKGIKVANGTMTLGSPSIFTIYKPKFRPTP